MPVRDPSQHRFDDIEHQGISGIPRDGHACAIPSNIPDGEVEEVGKKRWHSYGGRSPEESRKPEVRGQELEEVGVVNRDRRRAYTTRGLEIAGVGPGEEFALEGYGFEEEQRGLDAGDGGADVPDRLDGFGYARESVEIVEAGIDLRRLVLSQVGNVCG